MRKLAVRLLLLAALIVVVGCSVQKNTARTRVWHSFTARYNTYYNGHQAYIEGMLDKEKGNKDNYTEPLPFFTVGNKQSRQLGSSHFDRTIEKMEKTIKQHSIKARPEWKSSKSKTDRDKEWLSRLEYNPFLWKAWLLLGQAQFQKGEFAEAASTFNYMGRLYRSQPAINGVARAWLARCYTELDWMYDAEDVIRNMNRDPIHYSAQSAWNQTLANYYVHSGEYEKSIPLLQKIVRKEKRKIQKARLWFIIGQVQSALGHQQDAYKAFGRVAAQNPPYEMEFNARIAQTEVMAAVNAKKMISRLRSMARSDNNKDYLDQVYYAIGNIYLAQEDTIHAIAAYEQGNEKATRSGIEKGVLLLKLGNLYWELAKYNDAQRCYGEAIGLVDKDRADYEELSNRSKILDELVPFTDAIQLQDSLMALAEMPEKERFEAIDRVIEELKRKEKEERAKALEEEAEKIQQQQGAVGQRNRQQNNVADNNMMKNGQWYFYNQLAVNQGKQSFQRQWGKRENVDNWQRVNQTVVGRLATTDSDAGMEPSDSLTIDSVTVDADVDVAANDSLASDPHNREYYLAQIPFTDEQKQESNLIIMDGLYNAGVIFKDKLDNLDLARKQLVRLTGQYTDYEKSDQAWYHLFLLYSRLGDNQTADTCLVHMKEHFPESDWTTLLNDPYFAENARFGTHIEDSIYAATYDAFKDNRHDVIEVNANLSAERFPLGANRPKFIFIHGLSKLNQGDAKACAEDLKRVVEDYPQSEVAELAGMIVKGVQEGRQLYGGKFDLDDIWNRRDVTFESDSLASDTLSADRDVPYLFLIAYQSDSINENQLLYEMARFNFSNFLVRNFDLEIERMSGINILQISGFLNFDEARLYARQLASVPELTMLLRHCRTLVVSEHNLSLLGTRFSYADYEQFYDRYLQPVLLPNEELLQIPQGQKNTDPEDIPEEGQPQDEQQPQETESNGWDDDLFL